jgi:hypothetical protein
MQMACEIGLKLPSSSTACQAAAVLDAVKQ